MSLSANHKEYWKTIRREGHTLGFHWVPTFPSSRRLRFPWGRNKPVKMGWTVKSGVELRDEREDALDLVFYSPWNKALHRAEYWPTFRMFEFSNPEEGFDKDGNEIQRREK